MKFVYHYTIPIVSNYWDEVYYQDILFGGECPTKQEMLELLHKLHDETMKLMESDKTTIYDGTWSRCITSVEKAEEFPRVVKGSNCFSTNSFVELTVGNESVPKRYPISVQIREVY